MANRKTKATRKQRARKYLRAYLRQRGRCIWCGKRAWPQSLMSSGFALRKFHETWELSGWAKRDWLRDNAATMEHICPTALGGTKAFGLPHDHPNLVIAHALCNEERGTDIEKPPHPLVHEWLSGDCKRAFEALKGRENP